MGMLIMNKLNRKSWFFKTSLALLLTLGATVLMTDSKAYAVGGVITDCGGCHGYTALSSNPIADGASRNDAGKFQGSHAPHVIAQSTACSVCHTQPASNAHANGTVDINGTGAISGGTYGKASFPVSNGAFSPQNCSNVTCHEPYSAGTTTTPAWGTIATCDACHKGSGALATTGPASGSHAAHNNTNCSLCHTGATNNTTLPSANHLNSNINVANGYPATVTKHTFNTGYTGTCSSASCHANPYLVGGTVTSPVWGTASGCEACHTVASGGSIASTGPATGSHVAHNSTACNNCHANITTFAAAPTANHPDANINVSNGYPATVTKHTINTGYTGTCSTASCHANPYLVGGAVTSPVWGTASGCEACHTVASGGSIASTGPATGSHVAHNSTACNNCHANITTFAAAPTANHPDANINVSNGYPATVTKHTINTGYTGTCSTASCHANPYLVGGTVTSPVWGTASGCEACHTVASGGSIASTGPATGSHVAHNSTACNNCHANITTFAAAPTANHPDANINVSNGYPATVTKHTINTGYTGTCSAASCHANPYLVGGTVTSPVWGTASGCEACHTVASGGSIASTGPATGSHVAHNNTACNNCHANITTFAAAPTANHPDANINVLNGYPATVTKHTINTGYTGSCSAASCHAPYSASGSTPVWGQTAGCEACHANNATTNSNAGAFTPYSTTAAHATTATGPRTGSHTGHLNWGKTVCVDCHNAGTTSTTVPSTAHADGDVDATNGYTANVPKHTVASGYGGRTCSTNCHNPGNAHAWGTPLGCTDCHHVAITRKKGRPGKTLSAITTEFGLAWGHKKSGRGAVTSQDCIVCHLEGKWTTSYTAWSTSEYHADGNIDLRNPDGTGEAAITNIAGTAWTFQRFSTSYAAGTRTATGHTAEKIDNIVTQKFCLACHDSNGATNTTARNGATGTATMPWSGVNLGATYTTANGAAAAGGVINVKSQTLATNASFHPVQGPRFAGYPATSLMVAPYNVTRTAGTRTNSYVMTCFDCHNQTGTLLTTRTSAAHGNNVSLRAAFNFPTSAANMTVTNGQALCRVCHNPNATSGASGHYTGSAFGFSTGRSEKNAPLAYGCNSCHSSGIDNATSAARPVRAQDVHGYPSTVSGTATHKKAFIRGTGATTNTQLYNYVPKQIGTTTYSSTCTGMGGTICAGSRTRTNTPGGMY